jgi:hypothetical protein
LEKKMARLKKESRADKKESWAARFFSTSGSEITTAGDNDVRYSKEEIF